MIRDKAGTKQRTQALAFKFAAVMFFVLCGCASAGEENPAPETGKVVQARPNFDNKDTLTVVFSKGKVELDFRKSFMSSEAQLFTAVYEGLFSYNPVSMEPVPAVAESFEISGDDRQWTFSIRENAKFWNGDAVTSDDFRASWLSLLSDPAAPYSSLFDIIEGAKEYRNGRADADAVGISAPDPQTLVVKLIEPASFFPSMLCHHSFSPIHASMIDKNDWSLSPPVSNGPFRITGISPDEITMEKNEEYWDASSVSLSAIIAKFTTDDEASRLWNSGEAKWISGGVDIDALTDRSGINVHAIFGTHFYFIRSSEAPLDDYRVRRALAIVLPWEEIRAGQFLPAKTLIYPLPGYPEIDGLESGNPQEAKQLLADAGFPGGQGMPQIVFRIPPSQEASRIVSLMASAWDTVLGVSSRVEVVPYEEYMDSLDLDGYHIGSSTWIGDFPDPYSFLKMWMSDSNLNTAGLFDEDFEKLMEDSMAQDGEQRWETLARAEQLLLDRGSVLPVSFTPALNIIDTLALEGWFPNALGVHPFKYMSYRPLRPLPNVALAELGKR